MIQKIQTPESPASDSRVNVNTSTTHSNAAAAQRARLLMELRRNGFVTTIGARRDLDVLHPAMRILELRRAGHPIVTVWTREATACGKLHRVARYLMTPSCKKEAA
jgi:hypothetical protein